MEGDLYSLSHVPLEQQLPWDFFPSLQAKVDTVVRCDSGSPGVIDLEVPIEAIGKSLEDRQPFLAQSPAACREVWRVVVGSVAGEHEQGGVASTAAPLLAWMRALAKRLCEVRAVEANKVLLKTLSVLRRLLERSLRQGATPRQLKAVRDCAWYVLNCFHVMRTAYAVQAEAVWVLDGVAGLSASRGEEDEEEERERDGEGRGPRTAVLTADEFGAAAAAELCITMASSESKEGAGAKSVAVQLLGHLCRRYDVAIASVPGLSASALRSFLKVADRLKGSAKAPQELGKGFFRGLADFLLSFPLSYHDAEERRHLVLLCHLCVEAMGVALSTQAYSLTLAALGFLQLHACRDLAEPLYANAMGVYALVKQLWMHKNGPVRRATYSAATAFLRAVAVKLVEHRAEPHARATLAALLRDITDTLQGREARSTQVSLALVALGCMAQPIRCLDSPQVLHHVFGLLIEKTQALLPVASVSPLDEEGSSASAVEQSEWQSDIARLLPHLLSAFASFIGERSSLHEADVAAVEQLLDAVLTRYPTPVYFPRLRAVTVPALLQLLSALFRLQCNGARRVARAAWTMENEEKDHAAPSTGHSGSDKGDGLGEDDETVVMVCVPRVCAYLCERTFECAFAARVDSANTAAVDAGDGGGGAPERDGEKISDDAEEHGQGGRTIVSRRLSSPQTVTACAELWGALLSTRAAEMAAKALGDPLPVDALDGGSNSTATAATCVREVQLVLRLTCQTLAQQFVQRWDLALADRRPSRPPRGTSRGADVGEKTEGDRESIGDVKARVDAPRSAEDYRCFLLFVPFYTALAHSIWRPVWQTSSPANATASRSGGRGDAFTTPTLADALTDWLVALVRRSHQHPHVSGVLHLLYATLLAGNVDYNRPGRTDGAAAGEVICLPLSPAAKAVVQAHGSVCRQRMRVCLDELQYQCAVFVLVASSLSCHSGPSDGEEEGQEEEVLSSLRIVLAAHNTLSEDESRTELIARNRRAALQVLQHRLRARPTSAAVLLPALVRTPELSELPSARHGLAALAAEYGTSVAAALAHHEEEREASAAAEVRDDRPVPEWLWEKCVLRIPMPEQTATAFPVGRLIDPVAELCRHGATRKERGTARELFHFLVTWLIGHGAVEWYSRVFPVVAELAAVREDDGVAAGLFHDLLLQCAHWFASAPPSRVTEQAREQLEAVLFTQLAHTDAAMRRTATEALLEYVLWIGHGSAGDGGDAARRCALSEAEEGRLRRVAQKLQAALEAEQPLARLGAAHLLSHLLPRIGAAAAGNERAPHWLRQHCLLWWLRVLLDAVASWLARTPHAKRGGDAGEEEEVECLRLLASHLLRGERDDVVGGEEQCGTLRRRAVELMRSSYMALRDDVAHALMEVFVSLTEAGGGGGVVGFVKRNTDLFDECDECDECDEKAAKADVAGVIRTLVALARQHDPSTAMGPQKRLAAREHPSPSRRRPRGETSAPAAPGAWECPADSPHDTLAPLFASILARAHAAQQVEQLVEACQRASVSRGEEGNARPMVTEAAPTREAFCMLRAAEDTLTLFLDEDWDGEEEMLTRWGGAALAQLAVFIATRTATATDLTTGVAVFAPQDADESAAPCVRPLAVVCDALSRRPLGQKARRVQQALLQALRDALPNLLRPSHDTDQEQPTKSIDGDHHAASSFLANASVRQEMEAAAALLGVGPAGDKDAANLWSQLFLSLPPVHARAVTRRLHAVVRAALVSDALIALRTHRQWLCETAATLLLACGQKEACSVVDMVRAVVRGDVTWEEAVVPLEQEGEVSSANPRDRRQLPAHASSSTDVALAAMPPSHGRLPDLKGVVEVVGTALQRAAALCRSQQCDRTAFLVAVAEDITGGMTALSGPHRAEKSEEEKQQQAATRALAPHATRSLQQGILAALLLQTLRLLRGSVVGPCTLDGDQQPFRSRLMDCLGQLIAITSGDGDGGDSADVKERALAFQLRLLDAGALVDAEAVLALREAADGPTAAAGASVLESKLAIALQPSAFGGRPRTLLLHTRATRRFLRAVNVACAVLRRGPVGNATALTSLSHLCVSTVHAITTEELPLHWTELSPTTKAWGHYHQVTRAITSLAAACSPVQPTALLELLPILSQTDMPGGERLAGTVASALARLSAPKLEELCGECVKLQKEGGLPRDVWWTTTHRLVLPALRAFPRDAHARFFEAHMQAWVETASAPGASARQRSNALVLLEAMYRLADSASLKGPLNAAHVRATAAPTTTGTELTKTLIKATVAARKYAGPDAEEALHLRQCAHRCLTAVLMATQKDEGVFRKLLLDPASVDWNRLERREALGPLPEAMSFPQVADDVAKESSDWELQHRQLPAAERSPRDSANDLALSQPTAAAGSTGGGPLWSLSVDSGLSFSHVKEHSHVATGECCAVPAADRVGPLVDLDDVWKTTCCGSLLMLVDFLLEHFPSSEAAAGVHAPPAWVRDLSRFMADGAVNLPMRLVFVRLVQLRAARYFARYAAMLAGPMVAAATDPALGDALHYVARDTLLLVADWVRAGHYAPDVPTARRMLSFVVRTAPLADTTYHARCHVELFRELCALLPVHTAGCLPASTLLAVLQDGLSSATSAPSAEATARVSVGLQLCGVLVDGGTSLAALAALPSEATALHEALVRLLRQTVKGGGEWDGGGVAVSAAEVLAMEIGAIRAAGDEARAAALQAAVAAHLQQQWAAPSGPSQRVGITLLKALRVMQESCPTLAAALLPSALFHGFVGFGAEMQLLVLEVLGAAPELVKQAFYFETLRSRFAGALDKYPVAVCTALYVLLSLLVPHLPTEDIDTVADVFLDESALDALALSEDGRVAFFTLAARVQERQQRAADHPLHRLLAARGLTDPSSFVQDVVLECVDRRLALSAENLHSRVRDVLRALGSGTTPALGHSRWLQHAAVLMLSPARRTPHFTDATYLFPGPLQACSFTPRPVTATLGGRGGAAAADSFSTTITAVSRQLPLFSLPLGTEGASAARAAALRTRPTVALVGASQQQQQQQQQQHLLQQQVATDAAAGESLRRQYGHGKQLRSTVVPPAATALFSTFKSTRSAHAVHSTLLFTRKDDAAMWADSGASLVLPRRLGALSGAAKVARYMHESHQQRLLRERRERLQAAQRAQEVVVFRAYRDGEVPDVETSLEAFVTPLQALCLGSESIAALVCACLVEGAARDDTPRRENASRRGRAAAADAAAVPESPLPYFARSLADGRGEADGLETAASPQHVREALQGFLTTTVGKTSWARTASPRFTQFILEMALLLRWAPNAGEGWQPFPATLQGDAHQPAERVITGAVVELWEQTAGGALTACGKNKSAAAAVWLAGCGAMMRHGTPEAALLAARQAFACDGEEADASALGLAMRAVRDGAQEVAEATLDRLLRKHTTAARHTGEGDTGRDGKRALLLRLKREAAVSLLKWDAVLDTFPASHPGPAGDDDDEDLHWYAALRVNPTESAAALAPSAGAQHRGRTQPLVQRKHDGAARVVGEDALATPPRSPTAAHAVLRGLSCLLLDREATEDGISDCIRAAQEALPPLVFERHDCLGAYRLWLVLKAARALEQAMLEPHSPGTTAVLADYFAIHPGEVGRSIALEAPNEGGSAAVATLLDHALAVRQAMWQRVARGSLVDPADLAQLEQCSTSALVTLCRDGCDTLVSSRQHNGAVYRLMENVQRAVAHGGTLLRKALWVSVARAQLHHTVFTAPYTSSSASGLAAVREAARKFSASLGFADQRESYALAADEALCTITLAVESTRTRSYCSGAGSGVDLEALLEEARSLHAALGHLQDAASGDENDHHHHDLVLLDALDLLLTGAVLSGQSKSLTVDSAGWQDEEETSTAASMPPLEACWLLYAQTMARALAQGSRTPMAGLLLERVPRLLQIFELHAVCSTRHVHDGTTSDSHASRADTRSPWVLVLAQLAALPSAVWRPWVTQLINWLIRCWHPTVATLLLLIARDNPQLVYYPFNCAAEELRRLRAGLRPLAELFDFFDTSPELADVRAFTAALYHLQQPGPRLKSALARIYMDLQRAAAASVKADSDDFYDRASRRFQACFSVEGFTPTETVHVAATQAIEQNVRKMFLDAHGRLLRDPTLFKAAYNAPKGVKAFVSRPAAAADMPTELSAYSAWLAGLGASGSSGAVLLPRQPTTLLHRTGGANGAGGGGDPRSTLVGERIIAVHPTLQVMHSLQRPVRVRFLTTEGERDFLAKSGDDLRLDQRVEELFLLASGYLRRCDRRHGHRADPLRIRHFSVVPVSPSMGLVEWVAHTKVLQSVMEESLQAQTGVVSLQQRSEMTVYARLYPTNESYAASFRDESDRDVAKRFDGLVKKLPAHLLERGLQRMAPDRCRWFATRAAFTRSSSAFAAASYLFGIGDRHLGNCLVDTRTGEAISIDFGRAFGSATEGLIVPELMPFRLSPQLQAVQGAVGNALTCAHVERAMVAFRRHSSVLEGLATAFVNEPIVDWEYAHKDETGTAVAEEKVLSVYRKLNLESPCELMKSDVRRNKHGCVQSALQGIEATLDKHRLTFGDAGTGDGGGGSGNEERRELGDASEAARIQAFVRCLVGMATDSSILGRTYLGWMPLF